MSACIECGREDISPNKKVCTTCEQKMIRTNGCDPPSSGVDALSDAIDSMLIRTTKENSESIRKDDDNANRDTVDDNDDDDDADDDAIGCLFKMPPPKEECPICFLPMPYTSGTCGVFTTYQACCGKFICNGCARTASKKMNEGNLKKLCPFCRRPIHNSAKEYAGRLKERLKLDDAEAFLKIGFHGYKHGGWGLPQNMNKAKKFINKAAKLGSIDAHFMLARAYIRGEDVEEDYEKGLYHSYLAAMGGHERGRHNLGLMNKGLSNGNINHAMKHFMIAASCGYDVSMKEVGEGYKNGHVTKDEYAITLRAHKDSRDKMKSKERDEAEVEVRINEALGIGMTESESNTN